MILHFYSTAKFSTLLKKNSEYIDGLPCINMHMFVQDDAYANLQAKALQAHA